MLPFAQKTLKFWDKSYLLANGSELDGRSGWPTVEDLVLADRHGYHLCLERCGQLRHLDLSADSLVGLHVEALDPVCSVDLGHKLWMERDHHRGGNEYSSRI